MSDFNSDLPVRSNLPGQSNYDDIIVKLGDATNPTTQQASVDVNGSQRIVSNGPVTPGTVATFSNLIGGQYNLTLPTLTDTQQSAIQVDNRGRLLVTASVIFPYDENYGTVGANTLRTASQIGNATGAADFNYGIATAQTLRVTTSNLPQTVDTNYGTVGASTLRSAAQIGNSTGAADFNAGATGAQTLRVVANQGAPNSAANAWPISITSGGSLNSPTNPIYVSEDSIPGTSINDFKDASAIASGASDNHDYTVTAGKTLYLDQVESSASGVAKMQVEVETGVATNVFTSRFVQFNSTATPNMSVHLADPISVAAGVRVRVIMTNRDKPAQDLYSTISGNEQ